MPPVTTFPISSGTPSVSAKPTDNWTGVVSLGNSYRALDSIIFVLIHSGEEGLWAGADSVADVDGLGVVPPSGETSIVPFVTRDSEIADSAIDYRDLDRDAVNERLRELNIIVRPAVVAPSTGTP